MDTSRKDAEAAIRTVLSAVSSRPGIPALTGILVKFDGTTATLTGTDLETTATAHVSQIGANTEAADVYGRPEPFTALIPGKLMQAVVKQSPGECITIERVGSKAQIGK